MPRMTNKLRFSYHFITKPTDNGAHINDYVITALDNPTLAIKKGDYLRQDNLRLNLVICPVLVGSQKD